MIVCLTQQKKPLGSNIIKKNSACEFCKTFTNIFLKENQSLPQCSFLVFLLKRKDALGTRLREPLRVLASVNALINLWLIFKIWFYPR